MQAPVDYPIVDPARSDSFTVDELIYATRLDRLTTEEPASEETDQGARPGFRSVHDVTASNKVPTHRFAAVAQSLLASRASEFRWR